jgi:ribosomal protein S18 acetylase RimI-like enzyme
MTDVSIRKYKEGDREAIRDICYLTGYMGDSAAQFWRHKPSFVEVWTSYYLDHEPNSVYVAIQDASVVGYLTGCVETAAATKSEQIIASAIKKYGLLFRPGTAGFLWRAIFDGIKDQQVATGELIDKRWPSHLHINLLPVARGADLGAALMRSWLEQIKQSGSPGCHLGTLVENARAVSFFEKMGFTAHGEPSLVSGMRGLGGERLHQQFMVWSA